MSSSFVGFPFLGVQMRKGAQENDKDFTPSPRKKLEFGPKKLELFRKSMEKVGIWTESTAFFARIDEKSWNLSPKKLEFGLEFGSEKVGIRDRKNRIFGNNGV